MILAAIIFIGFSLGTNAGVENVQFREINDFGVSEDNTIMITYELLCNERFLDIVRLETIEEETQITTIHLGAWVASSDQECVNYIDNLFSSSAGWAYSGREYRIVKIQQSNFRPITPRLPPVPLPEWPIKTPEAQENSQG